MCSSDLLGIFVHFVFSYDYRNLFMKYNPMKRLPIIVAGTLRNSARKLKHLYATNEITRKPIKASIC